MLQKSLVTKSDIIIYDLEDSVPPTRTDKEGARERLVQFLQVRSLLHVWLPPSDPDGSGTRRRSPRLSCLTQTVLQSDSTPPTHLSSRTISLQL